MGLFNLGISKIEIADIASDGGAGTAFATLGLTQEGTAKMNFAEASKEPLKVEEFDGDADVVMVPGEKTIEFTIANPDEDTLVRVMGGTKTGTGASTIYKASASEVVIEKSLKITPKKGLGFIFPRTLITARYTNDLGKKSWLGVVVTVTVLQPTKQDEPIYSTFRV